jgi:hypothetical protein
LLAQKPNYQATDFKTFKENLPGKSIIEVTYSKWIVLISVLILRECVAGFFGYDNLDFLKMH